MKCVRDYVVCSVCGGNVFSCACADTSVRAAAYEAYYNTGILGDVDVFTYIARSLYVPDIHALVHTSRRLAFVCGTNNEYAYACTTPGAVITSFCAHGSTAQCKWLDFLRPLAFDPAGKLVWRAFGAAFATGSPSTARWFRQRFASIIDVFVAEHAQNSPGKQSLLFGKRVALTRDLLAQDDESRVALFDELVFPGLKLCDDLDCIIASDNADRFWKSYHRVFDRPACTDDYLKHIFLITEFNSLSILKSYYAQPWLYAYCYQVMIQEVLEHSTDYAMFDWINAQPETRDIVPNVSIFLDRALHVPSPSLLKWLDLHGLLPDRLPNDAPLICHPAVDKIVYLASPGGIDALDWLAANRPHYTLVGDLDHLRWVFRDIRSHVDELHRIIDWYITHCPASPRALNAAFETASCTGASPDILDHLIALGARSPGSDEMSQ